MPEVWKFKLAFKKAKLEQYGHRIWKVKSATGAITKTETFFQSLGMPTHLKDYKIDADEAAEKVRARFAERGVHLGEHDRECPANRFTGIRKGFRCKIILLAY